jgi:hypothetical protein
VSEVVAVDEGFAAVVRFAVSAAAGCFEPAKDIPESA